MKLLPSAAQSEENMAPAIYIIVSILAISGMAVGLGMSIFVSMFIVWAGVCLLEKCFRRTISGENGMWVAILFDEEESISSDAVMNVYGPFESQSEADFHANKEWDKLSKEEQEFRGFSIDEVIRTQSSAAPGE